MSGEVKTPPFRGHSRHQISGIPPRAQCVDPFLQIQQVCTDREHLLECLNLLTLLASLVQKQLNWNTRDPSLPNKALLFPSAENTHNIQRTQPPVFVSLSSKRTDKYFLLIYQETQEIIIILKYNNLFNIGLIFYFNHVHNSHFIIIKIIIDLLRIVSYICFIIG